MTPKETLTPVACRLDDCLYHRGDDGPDGQTLCAHRDRASYGFVKSCPLYIMDWKRRLTGS